MTIPIRTMRIPTETWHEIQRRAKDEGISATQFMLRRALLAEKDETTLIRAELRRLRAQIAKLSSSYVLVYDPLDGEKLEFVELDAMTERLAVQTAEHKFLDGRIECVEGSAFVYSMALVQEVDGAALMSVRHGKLERDREVYERKLYEKLKIKFEKQTT